MTSDNRTQTLYWIQIVGSIASVVGLAVSLWVWLAQ
jgi:hypothetical protein